MTQVDPRKVFTATPVSEVPNEGLRVTAASPPLVATPEMKVGPTENTTTEQPAGKDPEGPAPKARRSESAAPSAQSLLLNLQNGPDRAARRTDLEKMHKSLVESMRALGAGVADQQNEKAEKDRTALSDRIAEMEKAVNGMEAVLRIQLAPEMKRTFEDALARTVRPRGGRMRSVLLFGLTLLVGGAAGYLAALNADVLSAYTATASAALSELVR